jgi:hypothetical protein
MQRDDENLFTIILAGQLELAQRLEHPKRANLFQRIGVYCRLSKIDNRDLMRDYIEHRLERAGISRRLFTEAAYDAMWECSEQGVPRLINKVAKLALKAGQTQQLQTIDAPIVRQIGLRFGRMAAAISQERRERTRETVSGARLPDALTGPPDPEDDTISTFAPLSSTFAQATPPLEADTTTAAEESAQTALRSDTQAKQAMVADMIKFPDHIYVKAKKLPLEQRIRFAGQLAAEVLKRYPHLIQQLGTNNDPVPAWNALRNVVIRQIEQHLSHEPVQVG